MSVGNHRQSSPLLPCCPLLPLLPPAAPCCPLPPPAAPCCPLQAPDGSPPLTFVSCSPDLSGLSSSVTLPALIAAKVDFILIRYHCVFLNGTQCPESFVCLSQGAMTIDQHKYKHYHCTLGVITYISLGHLQFHTS